MKSFEKFVIVNLVLLDVVVFGSVFAWYVYPRWGTQVFKQVCEWIVARGLS